MGDQGNQESADSGSSITYTSPDQQQILQQVAQSPDRNEQVRSRWTPKPEQILILESIINSGMVNPPKDETIKIRKLLERFGPVGDANVFYWFQNRRSRSRRRQRQMQASYMEANNARNVQNTSHYYDPSSNLYNPSDNIIMPIASEFAGMSSSFNAAVGASLIPPFSIPTNSSETFSGSAYSSYSPSSFTAGFNGNGGVDSYFSEMGFKEKVEGNGSQAIAPPYDLCTSDGTTPDSHFQPPGVAVGGGGEGGGVVTVFLNGVATEVPSGPLDMKAMCGQDFLLVHSSGQPVPINEYGFSAHSLQHGESYFLVAKSI